MTRTGLPRFDGSGFDDNDRMGQPMEDDAIELDPEPDEDEEDEDGDEDDAEIDDDDDE